MSGNIEPTLEPIPHDRVLCDFCRTVDELTALHYSRLTTSFRIPPEFLPGGPSTYAQEQAMIAQLRKVRP